MLRNLLLALLGVSVVVMDDGSHVLLAQNAFPHVVGPTGRPYGPTQAHYQYERQYGRPWYGGAAPYDPNTGANIRLHGGWHQNGGYYGGYFPFAAYGYNYQGFPGYGYQYGYGGYPQFQAAQTPMPLLPLGNVPQFAWQQPGALQQFQGQQPQARQPAGPGGPPVQVGPGQVGAVEARPVGPPEPVLNRPHDFMPAEPSTAAQRQRSIHLQGQGDIWFRQQNFLQAYSRYKQAAGAAPDLAAPHFRMAYALLALQKFDLAVPEFQRGIQLDPQYPSKGESPEQVFGEANRLAAAALPQAVAAWVKQDIRSPDRLFLLGALLTMGGDQARARVLLQTAAEFGGPTNHVIAFLKVTEQPAIEQAAAVAPAEELPPVPEAVEKMLKENQNWLPARPQAHHRVAPQIEQTTPRTVARSGKSPVETSAKAFTEPSPKPSIDPKAKPAVQSYTPKEAGDLPDTKKSYPLEPGYVAIPKKGAVEEPAADPEPEVVPVEATSSEQESGPVIPIPTSGN